MIVIQPLSDRAGREKFPTQVAPASSTRMSPGLAALDLRLKVLPGLHHDLASGWILGWKRTDALAGKAGGVAAASACGMDAARSHPATTSRLRRLLAGCALIGLAFLSRCELTSPVLAAESQSPRAFVDTVYRPPAGRRLLVRAGGQLQLALDAAQPGDTIVREPGATFRGNFILPKKDGSGWIIVRSGANDALLPPPGVRAGPDTAGGMAKMITPNSSPVIVTAPGAHHYRFIGVEFTVGKDARSDRVDRRIRGKTGES